MALAFDCVGGGIVAVVVAVAGVVHRLLHCSRTPAGSVAACVCDLMGSSFQRERGCGSVRASVDGENTQDTDTHTYTHAHSRQNAKTKQLTGTNTM